MSAKGDTIPTTLSNARGMQALGEEAKRLILLRTSRGRDASGRTFQAYSPQYVLSGNVDSRRPDLTRTGAMLASLTVEASATSVRVYAKGIPYARFVNARRRFMGLAPDDMRSIVTAAQSATARAMGDH